MSTLPSPVALAAFLEEAFSAEEIEDVFQEALKKTLPEDEHGLEIMSDEAGWASAWSKEHTQHCYYNRLTGERFWTQPLVEACVDKSEHDELDVVEGSKDKHHSSDTLHLYSEGAMRDAALQFLNECQRLEELERAGGSTVQQHVAESDSDEGYDLIANEMECEGDANECSLSAQMEKGTRQSKIEVWSQASDADLSWWPSGRADHRDDFWNEEHLLAPAGSSLWAPATGYLSARPRVMQVSVGLSPEQAPTPKSVDGDSTITTGLPQSPRKWNFESEGSSSSTNSPIRLGEPFSKSCATQTPWGKGSRRIQVNLYVYDLAWATQLVGLPIYHLGIEVYSHEFSYGHKGVECCKPGRHSAHPFREAMPLGFTTMTFSEIWTTLSLLRQEFKPGAYNLLCRNCQTFAVAFSSFLGLTVPSDYCRFSEPAPFLTAATAPAPPTKPAQLRADTGNVTPKLSRPEVTPERTRSSFPNCCATNGDRGRLVLI